MKNKKTNNQDRNRENDKNLKETSVSETLVEMLEKSNVQSPYHAGKTIEVKALLKEEFSLFHIQELTFDDELPRKEAFENVLSTLNIEGIMFVYLLLGDESGVSFYFGIAKDKYCKKELEVDVDDIGKNILKPSIEGNFRGSRVVGLKANERVSVKDKLKEFTHVARVNGVPSVNEDNEEFQGVDRLVDVMSGDRFCLAIIADPLSLDDVNHIENSLHMIHDKISPLSKQSIQSSENTSETKGTSTGASVTQTTGVSDSRNAGLTTSTSSGVTEGTSSGRQSDKSNSGESHSTNKGESQSTTEGSSKGTSSSTATADNSGESYSSQTGVSKSTTREFANKSLQEWAEYIDEVLLKRIQYGKNKGLYLSNIYLFSNSRGGLLKLGNTVKSLFSGVDETKAPLSYSNITRSPERESIENFQMPRSSNGALFSKMNNDDELALLHSKSSGKSVLASWLSTNELSVVAGLPQKEVVGLTLKEEVEFGLNMGVKIGEQDRLYLGNLVKSGQQLNLPVDINKHDLDKHTFIAGVTGSGKTTTCHRILNSAEMPFLVIEPAKTEYRVLTKQNKNLLIFTLGNDNVAPFRLNPFEFFAHENITSRVDMIKASIEAAFDMEAAIPQIIEAAIYRCYEDYGWDIATSKNHRFEDPFADGVYAFPKLEDLIAMSEKVVEDQGFDDRLKQDYIGSIKARLQGLLIGAKGLMLNTPRSIDFKELALRNVVLELEEIRNPSEKSLVMGFVLANLNEAIRANYIEFNQRGEQFKHITLIEEAHRLLSKYEAGDSLNKKQGVEAFADMLAEVRKYGEALVIVDQIPNKLTPEVLKNTNTKIIHKLFAKDDKEAVGNTMALEDEQKDFLSSLGAGRVILSSTGMTKPIQVQIEELVSTTSEVAVEPAEIRKIAVEFYQQTYRRGVIPGLELAAEKPSLEVVEGFLQNELTQFWKETVSEDKANSRLREYCQLFGVAFVTEFIFKNHYATRKHEDNEAFVAYLSSYLSDVNAGARERLTIKEKPLFKLMK